MDKKYFIFRNTTIEPLFINVKGCSFSGYNDFEFQKGFEYYVWFYLLPLNPDRKAVVEELDFFTSKLGFLLSSLPNDSQVLCFTIEDFAPFRFFEESEELRAAIAQYNARLFEFAKENSNVKVLQFDDFTSRFSKSDLIDWRYYYLSMATLHPKLSAPFQEWFFGKIKAIEAIRKKCLVLDLDNTLWGGILGEDGIEGIQIGNAYPGSCFADFQRFILQMKQTGVILAICSKNNLRDAEEAFANKSEMVLRLEDFSSVRINWNMKPENLAEIAAELNIGLDSFVFIDDNPAERELVKKMLPEVIVPEFPASPYLMLDFITGVYRDYFQMYKPMDEDLKKADQYEKNALRNKEKSKFGSKDDFIRELGITIDIREADKSNIARIAQMTQKTNQFNLTTKRYTESDIHSLLNKGYRIWCAAVKDKFGDHGITAVLVINIIGNKAVIDSFLLSCRILGYGIEHAFLFSVINKMNEEGVTSIEGQYIPSPKNMQAQNFFDELGFQLLDEEEEGSKKYTHQIDNPIDISPNYKIIT